MARIGPARNCWEVNEERVSLLRPRPAPRRVQVPARPQDLELDLARTACVVVDMQNDFCSPGGWLDSAGVDVSAARAPVGPLRSLLPPLRSQQVPVVWCNWGNRPDRANLPPGVLHVYDREGSGTGIGELLPGKASRVLQRGEWSTRLVEGLSVEEEDLWVDKYRMSGFFDTELDSILRNLDVTTLLFAGVNLDQCVFHTLADAACLGYDVVLLEDCCATTSPYFCVEATLHNVATCYGFVAAGEHLLARLDKAHAVVAT